MTDEEKEEEYLRKNGWYKCNQEKWAHKNCNYECCTEVALEMQQMRDKKEQEKLSFNKVFEYIINKFSGAIERLK